jgi:hypothetical protein
MTILSKNDLKRANFAPEDFFKSATATRLKIKNYPEPKDEQRILTNLMKLADKIQEVRTKAGLLFIPSNIYRCPALNKAVKGSPNSKHMQGLAIDGLFQRKNPLESAGIVLATGVKFDRLLIELTQNCIHFQVCLNDKENRNEVFFAEIVDGKWRLREFKA